MRAGLAAVAVAVVLADSSIVTLALPDLVRAFDSGVADAAWVLISFNLVLALAALPAAALVRASGVRVVWTVGLVTFSAASLVCAIAPGLGVLVVARAVQALGGAAIVAAALGLLGGELEGRRAAAVWGGAGVFGAAVGPALGGALTQLLSWEAIFAVQVPLLALVPAGRRARRGADAERVPAGRGADAERSPRRAPPAGLVMALALVSAALTAALFLLVVMLIEGWRLTPAAAAGVVSVMPLVALAAAPLGRRLGDPRVSAAVGAVAIGGGLAALGLLPGAHVGWTLAPQLLIGLGLGLALSALTEIVLLDRPDALMARAAWTIAARHAGVVVGLALLTPLFTRDLDDQELAAERAGSALLLDARLSPGLKVALGERLAEQVQGAGGRLPRLGPAFRGLEADPEERAPLERLRTDLQDELERAATQAFSRSFLAGAGLALLVLVPLSVRARRRRA